jgi:hypothetical protein
MMAALLNAASGEQGGPKIVTQDMDGSTAQRQHEDASEATRSEDVASARTVL